ncbi:hypothetical protein TERTU_3992 [Teredinibacter turnerae T7901]|uniref:Uncharacterized protein n=1 Tax=Teredinibacter turnerae (strain ATCC 39867 / T7901) TaxID=377629 RepID=C5BTR9_TERTT|nr:hypothetical protein [Teredinibacter turnerae]ACR11410.1 hypothetical protein TERTU_3992 [Teredinibacter turnerae T7901]
MTTETPSKAISKTKAAICDKKNSSQESIREGRKYAFSSIKGKSKGKVRYIETNDPSKGCRFL